MTKEKDLILVTDWEEVADDDFYLSEDWEENGGKENIETAKELKKEGKLFYGYIVPAVNYTIYVQMDVQQVLIDDNFDIIVSCESTIISNGLQEAVEFSY